MISKLEIYGIVLAVLIFALVGAYFKGRHDEQTAITQKTLADNAAVMKSAADAAIARAAADDASRQKTADLMEAVEKGIANVQAKFSSLPSVVVDARGCERLTPDAGMRWNSVELLPPGPALSAPGSAPAALPAGQVHAP